MEVDTLPEVDRRSGERMVMVVAGSNARAAWALFIVAFCIGIVQLLHPVGYGLGPGYETAAIARNLVARGTFGNPFDLGESGLTAVVPPLHPMLLAAFFWLPVPWSLILAVLGNVIANAVTAALLPGLSKRFCGDRAPGIGAGFLWMFAMQLMPAWDGGYTLAALLAFLVLTTDTFEATVRPGWAAAGGGLAAGIISNENPATLPILALWICFLLIRREEKLPEILRHFAVFALLIAAANAPWLIRNYRIWHAFTLRTNFGMTFYSSNNDCAQSSLKLEMESGCYQRNHPAGSASELALMNHLGEVAFDRERTKATLKWIRSHPRRFEELTVARIREFWFPGTQSPLYTTYAAWFISALSIPGILLMLRKGMPIAWVILILWMVYPLPYYVVVSGGRYRYPIIWSSLLAAGFFLAFCGRCARRQLLEGGWRSRFATVEIQGG